VVTGAGGPYSKDTFGKAGDWDAFRSDEYSYSDIVVNRTHLTLTQRYANGTGVLDKFTITN